jgi:hypothetical protein
VSRTYHTLHARAAQAATAFVVLALATTVTVSSARWVGSLNGLVFASVGLTDRVHPLPGLFRRTMRFACPDTVAETFLLLASRRTSRS